MREPSYKDVESQENFVEPDEIIRLWENGFSVLDIEIGCRISRYVIYRTLRDHQTAGLLKRPVRPYRPRK